MRNPAREGARATVWVLSLLSLAVLLAVGIGWGLSHRFSIQSPGLSPELPTLPGKEPEPKNP